MKLNPGTLRRAGVLSVMMGAAAACAPAARISPSPSPNSAACFLTERLSAEDRALGDTLLAAALDNEGLYTLLGSVKPMSSVRSIPLRTARPDSLPAGTRAVADSASADLARMQRYQRVANALTCDSIRMVVVPFRLADSTTRILEISVINAALLDRVIARDQAFWGQWGFVPGTDPAVLVTATEFGAAADRFRGYGYLFGYPEHAVTFFVQASGQSESTGTFVQRDFFQIPAFSGDRGRFVYAVPRGYAPREVDLALRARAESILAAYRERRPRYQNPDGTLRASELLRAWYAEGAMP